MPLDLKDFKPKDKGMLSPGEPEEKARLGKPVGVRFTPSQLAKLQEKADEMGIGQIATTIRALLRKHGYI